MTYPENRPRAADLVSLSAADIAALPPEILVQLQEETDAQVKAAKDAAARLGEALEARYGERAAAARRAQGKHTGSVRIEDGPVIVTAELPKRVDWDQDRLAAMVAKIRDAGADPAEYVETSYRVSERKYAAWPESIREDFTAARTVRTGKPGFRLIAGEVR